VTTVVNRPASSLEEFQLYERRFPGSTTGASQLVCRSNTAGIGAASELVTNNRLNVGKPRLVDLHVKLGEIARIHDKVDAGDFIALDREQERRANLTAAHRPYRAGLAVDNRG
jgi:hypothetical protein